MANPTPTPAAQWKKKGEELSLPSGNVCLVKRPGMEKLFAAGVLPDELTKIAIESIERAENGLPQDHKVKKAAQEIDPAMLKKFLESENAITSIFQSFDRVAEMCIIEPRVRWHMKKVLDEHGNHVTGENGKPQYEEIHEAERDDNIVYTDEIDIDDKTFIFNFVVGGTRDVEQFRAEYSDAVADVQSGEDVEMSSESTGEHKE